MPSADHGPAGVAGNTNGIPVASSVGHLPALPSVVRYYDDYLEENHSIRNYAGWRSISLELDGREITHDFSLLDTAALEVLRHIVLDWFGRLDAKTVRARLSALQPHPVELARVITAAVTIAPDGFRQLWIEWYASGPPLPIGNSLRQVLFSLCRLAIGPWTRDHESFVTALPQRQIDHHKAVLGGNVFLPIDQQATLVGHFDDVADRLAVDALGVDTETLRTTCILMLGYQFSVRPGQTARLKRDDVTIHSTGAVHIRFLMTKQRDQSPVHHIRRVTRRWCPLITEYARRRDDAPVPEGVHPASFFGLPPHLVASRIEAASKALLGEVWTPRDYRHTGAQRLADGGASHEEIQEFLMQAGPNTAGIYFSGSATQAAKVNRAMGLSPIYRAVERIARTRTIDMDRLLALPADNQVGGMPHGIPIAGIGACEVGQPNCTKNPVFSCYGCFRFMAVRDATVHEQVADGLRGVVRHFYEFEPEAGSSPAYGQLRHVIEAADRLASEIRTTGVPEDGDR